MSDRSFRSPHEIRRRLGLPILGHVPQFDPAEVAAAEAPGMDLGLCTIHNPKGTESEAYRGVRTALCFSTRGERHQLIQVTSPTQGDGKSTLCANLAISMAQSGKRVLLIDADCRRPRQHRLFNVTNARGLVTVITDQATANEVIQPTPVPNLSVLVCGPRPNNPAELLTSPRFAEVLEELRPSYDFIIVDTPPMLAVSDPSVVAPRVDGVLVTIRLSRNGRPAAERAKEMLMAIGANILGIVVNGLGRKGKDGYYETDSYGYAYEYEYEYAYAYEPDDSDSAVDLDDAKVAEPASAVSNGTGDDGANSAVNLGDNPRGRRRRSSKNGSRGNGRPFGWLRFWG